MLMLECTSLWNLYSMTGSSICSEISKELEKEGIRCPFDMRKCYDAAAILTIIYEGDLMYLQVKHVWNYPNGAHTVWGLIRWSIVPSRWQKKGCVPVSGLKCTFSNFLVPDFHTCNSACRMITRWCYSTLEVSNSAILHSHNKINLWNHSTPSSRLAGP